MPVILWPRSYGTKWLVAAFMALWTLLMWFMSRGTGRVWSSQLYLLFFPIQMYIAYANVRYVLGGGVLAILRGFSAVQRIPLAVAELQRRGNRHRLRWPRARRMQTLWATWPAAFAAALERAALSARSAAPGSVPATVTEAAQAVTFGFPVYRNVAGWVFLLVLALLGLLGLAVWLNQPLVLLPLAVLPLLADRAETARLLMLSGDHLWLLTPGAGPHPIPITSVQGIRSGFQTAVIVTRDALHPEIRLNRYQSPDLLRHLRRRLRGEPATVPGTAQVAGPAAPPVLRCSLCGRAAPGGGADGTVHICDPCAGRARFEAAESGHGLTGKEPQPM